jgi:hypothetical protein
LLRLAAEATVPNLPLLFASLLFAAIPTLSPLPSAPESLQNPIALHLMTVVDHADMLGGQRVTIHVARVKQVLAPRLVVVNEPRIRGIDATYETFFRLDKLLVLLPRPVAVSRGQLVRLTGTVRTIAAGRALGLPLDEVSKSAKKSRPDAKWMTRIGNRPLLVADSVETPDGVVLGMPGPGF